jgi:hypothetical protein
MERQFNSFSEFWPYYASEHSNPLNRKLHFVGTTCVLGIAATALGTGQWWLLGAAPVAGYGFAWIGHFFVEKNKPATFTYPLWSLAGDFVMYYKMLRGEMDGEVAAALEQFPRPAAV